MIKNVAMNHSVPANLLTSVRVVTNLFKNSSFHNWLQLHRSEVPSQLVTTIKVVCITIFIALRRDLFAYIDSKVLFAHLHVFLVMCI